MVRAIRADQKRLNEMLDMELEHVLEKDVTKAYDNLRVRYEELESRYELLARAAELDGNSPSRVSA